MAEPDRPCVVCSDLLSEHDEDGFCMKTDETGKCFCIQYIDPDEPKAGLEACDITTT